MRRVSVFLLAIAAVLTASGASGKHASLKGFVTVRPVTRSVPAPALPAPAVVPLPTFTYNVTASPDLGGGSYSGKMIGTSPFATNKKSTTITVQIVPLDITINDGSTVRRYSPVVADPCSAGNIPLTIVAQSPIFEKDVDWTMNGVDIGQTQYIDAFQRAQFWSLVGGSNYHVILKRVILPTQKMTFKGSASGLNYDAGGCGRIGVVNIDDLDARLQALITGPLASRINAGTFPIFVTKDVVSSESGVSLSSCCVLGYHSGMNVGGNLQIYSPFAYDSSTFFGADVTTLSHEMAEAVNDPTGVNPTPVWGHIGQVGGCQGNFEVGDPLSEGFTSPTAPFTVQESNGLIYHLQELAFFDWFYGRHSRGAGGKYSDNGTFGGHAILCSAGGGTH